MISDVSRCRPRAFVHRHKFHDRPPGFTCAGPNEVRMIAEQLEQMLKTDANPNGIFHERPHMTWDNFFSGDSIMHWLGQKGFAATMTCRRDRLPKDVPKKYFHHEKGPSDLKSKVARFEQPITAVQHFPAFPDEGKKAFTRTHVSFQSTGATNISTVNALNSSQLYAVVKQRGIGDEKRQWGIEMNEARLLYLKTYGRIDTIDSLINHSHMNYRSQKYWHSAMIEALALAVVTAYDMYLEAASGSLCPEWKLEEPMSFHTFRDRLSSQALQYKARNKHYPGDEKTRAFSQLATKQNRRLDRSPITKGLELSRDLLVLVVINVSTLRNTSRQRRKSVFVAIWETYLNTCYPSVSQAQDSTTVPNVPFVERHVTQNVSSAMFLYTTFPKRASPTARIAQYIITMMRDLDWHTAMPRSSPRRVA